MSDSEWEGEPHTLTVHAVDLPESHFDNGDLHYDLEHRPPASRKNRPTEARRLVMEYTCELAVNEAESGLSFSLRYSRHAHHRARRLSDPVVGPEVLRLGRLGL